MSDTVDILELNRETFSEAHSKNELLSRCAGEYIGFLQKEDVCRKEILDIYEENPFLKDYDAVVFGENIPNGETDLSGMLSSCAMRLFGFVVKRSLFADTGCFNEKLSAGVNYEFLCRCAAEGRVYCIPCVSESGRTDEKEEGSEKTYVYALRRYMTELKACGGLEAVFGGMSRYFEEKGILDKFNECVRYFLEEKSEYEQIAADTAPIFIISGDETCYGVLNDFANVLADELVSLGQSVVTTNGRYGNYEGMDSIDNIQLKAVVGFQAPVLERDYFKRRNCRKFQFWFDNPAFFTGMFSNLTDGYYFLCQDKYYAEHLQTYYRIKNAIQFPPAGRDGGYTENTDRPYDVVFIGTFNRPRTDSGEDLQRAFYGYMLNHPRETFESGLRMFLAEQGVEPEEKKFLDMLWYMARICRDVIDFYRAKVIEIILAAGIKVHVYGDSWKNYDGVGGENLILHEAVSVEESLRILGEAKVGLNVMSWHKAGMTERIANIMLSGAVCLSDETVYLREHFAEDEEIVLFRLDRLNELPGKIERLLCDGTYRQNIAKRAYKKALENHTWRQRAEELLKLCAETGEGAT